MNLLQTAEAYLLNLARQANSDETRKALDRARRALFQTSPGRTPKPDADAVSAVVALIDAGVPRPIATRTVCARMGYSEKSDRDRLRKKVGEILFGRANAA